MRHTQRFVFCALGATLGCGGGSSSEYEIVTASGSAGALTAVAGDGLALAVVEKAGDGTSHPLPASATVTWTMPATVTAADPATPPATDPLPAPDAEPSGVFVSNPQRPDITDDIGGVLFVLDPGTSGSGMLEVAATVSTALGRPVTAEVAVTATPAGNATNGQQSYLEDCSTCHGPIGDGSTIGSDGMYNINGAEYPYPAEGLSHAAGVAGSAGWNAALFAFASRADMNIKGVALRVPMPNWLVNLASVSQKPPTTQELADIYAYLAGQTQ